MLDIISKSAGESVAPYIPISGAPQTEIKKIRYNRKYCVYVRSLGLQTWQHYKTLSDYLLTKTNIHAVIHTVSCVVVTAEIRF